jgi:hypothetical protein
LPAPRWTTRWPWSLLIVVVAIAGAGGQQLRLLLAPVYAGVMFGVVRPLLPRPGCLPATGPAYA